MNLHRFLILLPAFATISFAENPPAENAVPPAPKLDASATAHVAVDVAVFAVPDEVAFTLLAGLRDPAKIEETAHQLETMAAKKDAQVLAWPQATAISGQRAHSSSADEFRYATEFDPPQDPAGDAGAEAALKDNAAHETAEAVSAPEEKPRLVGTRATPTAFETRDLGTQLDIEPVLSDDGQRVVVAVKFSWAQFRGWTTLIGMVWQPQFTTLKSECSLVLRSGGHGLLGVRKLESPANHVAIVVARATVEKAAR